MPCELKWYLKDRVLLERLHGVVTLEDVKDSNVQLKALLASGVAPTHVIVDLSGVERFPTSLSTIKEFVKPVPNQEILGWVLIFGAQNSLLRFLASMVTQFTGDNVRMRMFDDLTETLDFIRKQDETLADIPMPD